jgi:hypothetical protein
VYPRGTGIYSILSNLRNSSGNGSYWFMVNGTFSGGGTIQFGYNYVFGGSGGNDILLGTGTLPVNVWSFVAITRSGANIRGYVNGVQVGTTNTSIGSRTIYPTNENYFKNVYAFTSLGKVYYNNLNNIWENLKLPTDASGIAKTLVDFKISSDKLSDGSYQTYQYGLTSDKAYYSIIPDNTAYQNWNWNEISTFYNTSGVAITNIYNLSGIEEVSTQRTTYVENAPDDITVQRALYVGAIGTSTKGLYYGDFSQLSQL